jgi:hypothetical protein
MIFFIHFVCQKNNWKKVWTLDLWVERIILTGTSPFFSLKLLFKKDTYNISHCMSTIKKNLNFFSCWALYYKCIKPGTTFYSLCMFSDCQEGRAEDKRRAQIKITLHISLLCKHYYSLQNYENLNICFDQIRDL